MNVKNFQIALETGFGAGSLTIFEDGEVLDFLVNDSSELKAENLLEQIAPILESKELRKCDIKKIIYAKTNGSQTGLKIGESLAKGMSLGLSAEIVSRDLYECMLNKFRMAEGSALMILPYGKKDLECRLYESYKFTENPPSMKFRGEFDRENFFDLAKNVRIFTQEHLLENDFPNFYEHLKEKKYQITDLGKNLSQYLNT